MNISSLSKYALGTVAAAGILAGCSNGGQTGGMGAASITPSATRYGLATSVAHNGILHAISGPVRVSPDDRKSRGAYAYFTDAGTNTIYVYNYSPKTGMFGTEVGSTTSGLSEPQGACASSKGDVWVTNTLESQVLEFKTPSTTSSGSVTTPHEYPVGCSVDKKGDVAVSSILSAKGGGGNVEIFKKGTGTPTSVTCSNLEHYYFLAYDKKGNIWVDGENSSSDSAFCEIKAGATSGTPITLNENPKIPGGVQVYGRHHARAGSIARPLTILDQDASAVDRYTISGTTGTEVGTVTLSGPSDLVTDWIVNKFVLTANTKSADVTSFAYPAGGSAVSTVISTVSGLSEPIGITVAK